EIIEKIRSFLPQGISYDDKIAVAATLSGLAAFVSTSYQSGKWSARTDLKESELQQDVLTCFRAREVMVEEASKLGGGEFDLRISNRTLVENKVAGKVSNPFEAKPDAPYQANRYAIATCQRIFFTVVGYIPRDA